MASSSDNSTPAHGPGLCVAPMLGLHDPGQPWEQWGCPIGGRGQWFLGPWDLEGHTAAEHPGWTATYELLRPYPNQRQRVVYRRSSPPAS
jgi:hypothetical protein